jgi:deoxyribonuclease-4
MSVAGGLPLASDRAALHGCQALQIFTKNASQWRGRELPDEEVAEFRARVSAAGIAPVISHASYLINLASPDGVLRTRSIAAMADEIDRA